MIKVGMVSLGCPKNQIDAELLLHTLVQNGFALVEEAGMAEVAIVNTCGFIKDAKEESIAEILELAQLKKEGKIKAIIVTGCMAERYRQELLDELPEVDAVVGIGKNNHIVNIIHEAMEKSPVLAVGPKEDLPLNGPRLLTTPPYMAYLKISEGCDNRCSYCAIPSIRGGFRSRPMEEIVKEAEILAKKGVKELVLVAQDTTRYGADIYEKAILPDLCKKLCIVDGVEWIRLLYCYPQGIDDELLQVMAAQPKMAKYMDIPLQHCSKEVLKRMNRQGDEESLSALMEHIRNAVPGITLRTTVMVGFPGETEKDFTALSRFVNAMKFDRLGCFAFSPEEGTPAFDMADQLSDEVKEYRQRIIMEQQMEIMQQKLEAQQGQTMTVLVEGFDKYAGVFFGRSQSDAPEIDGKIFFTSGKTHKTGDFVTVTITDMMDYDLLGEEQP